MNSVRISYRWFSFAIIIIILDGDVLEKTHFRDRDVPINWSIGQFHNNDAISLLFSLVSSKTYSVCSFHDILAKCDFFSNSWSCKSVVWMIKQSQTAAK
jgi:hypothetical protein